MMKNKKIIIIAIVLIAISSILFYNFSHEKDKNKENIELGSILILTGEGSSWGEAARNGIALAINDINENGGINGKMLEVLHQDDKGDPKEAVYAFRQLTDTQGIRIIIGTSWSRTGLSLADIADKNKILMISPSLGVKEFNEKSPYLFNTWPHDYLLSRQLADYVYSKGIRKVAVIGAEEVWVKDQTINFRRRFEELGGKIIVLAEPDPSEKAPYGDDLKIKAVEKDIDAIVSTTDGVLIGTLIAKRVRELGVKLPIYSITVDKDIIDASQGAYEGMEYLTSLTPIKEFQERYEKTYSIPIDIGADSAYDAVMLIAIAIRETNSEDPDVLQKYLNNLTEYQGASGHLTFDGKGGVTKQFITMKVVNGTGVKIS